MHQYAYIPHNPKADITTDDLVAFPYGKRTIFKAAGFITYYHHVGADLQQRVDNGVTIQGQHRPVQKVNKTSIIKHMGLSNLNAARGTTFREPIFNGKHDHSRIFPPFYSRPRLKLDGSDPPVDLDFSSGFYLCRECAEPLFIAPATNRVTCASQHFRP